MSLNLTLLGQFIAFFMFVGFCWKLVWPQMMQALEERQQRIQRGLNDADKAKAELQRVKEDVESMLTEARVQAKQIVEGANARSATIAEAAKAKAAEEAARQIEAAKKEIMAEADAAREKLIGEVGGMVMQVVDRALQSGVSESAQKKALKEVVGGAPPPTA